MTPFLGDWLNITNKDLKNLVILGVQCYLSCVGAVFSAPFVSLLDQGKKHDTLISVRIGVVPVVSLRGVGCKELFPIS